MAIHPDVDRFRRAFEARNQSSLSAADAESLGSLLADNVIWYGAATGVADGAWGKEQVVSSWNALTKTARGLTIEVSAVFADGLHTVVVLNISSKYGRTIRQLNVIEMNEETGKANAIWATPNDAAVANAFAHNTEIPEHRNLPRFRLAEASRDRWAFEPEDVSAIEGFLRPDVIWRGAGNSQWKDGVHTRPEVFKWYRLFKQVTNNSIDMDIHETFAGDQWACSLVTISAQNPQHPERHMSMPEVNLFHLDPEGRCFEYWGIAEDQAAMDAFWAT